MSFKISVPAYNFVRLLGMVLSKYLYRCRVLRNEIKGVEGPYVLVANHESRADFVNVIGLTRRPIHFVISNAFYQTLPFPSLVKKIGLLPKQQFQTNFRDLKTMKSLVKKGNILCLYPAGLNCEDGISTPIPQTTGGFLKWLGVDVYAVRSRGGFFSMPKWGDSLRRCHTTIETYRLFSKEEALSLPEEEMNRRLRGALFFDAYRESGENGRGCRGNRDIRGLERVLYRCPNCLQEFTMQVEPKDTIFCTACGFTEKSDEKGILHKITGMGKEISYVSDWSRWETEYIKEKIKSGSQTELFAETEIFLIDTKKRKFVFAGEGTVTLTKEGFHLEGTVHGKEEKLDFSLQTFPMLPFTPEKYIELQKGMISYRCVLKDGHNAIRMIQMLKAYRELENL